MITEYHRPSTLEQALHIAASPGAVVVAGGTWVNAHPDPGRSIAVDLQALDLGGIEAPADTAWIGAMTTLQELVDSPAVPDTLRELARREAPRTFRNMATIGGTIGAGDPESQLLAGLLAYEARVVAARPGPQATFDLDELLGNPRTLGTAIMTSIAIPTGGAAASVRTARTPADTPIVTVVGRRHEDRTVLAMTGVAHRPMVVDPLRIDDLRPPADFRGSSAYRRHLAATLGARVLDSLDRQAAAGGVTEVGE